MLLAAFTLISTHISVFSDDLITCNSHKRLFVSQILVLYADFLYCKSNVHYNILYIFLQLFNIVCYVEIDCHIYYITFVLIFSRWVILLFASLNIVES